MAYIDIIKGIEFSDAQAGAIAALIGAVAATILAAGSTMFFANKGRKDERNDQEVARRRAMYIESGDAINKTLYQLDTLANISRRNMDTMTLYSQGLFDEETNSIRTILNSPVVYSTTVETGQRIYNSEAQKYWENLMNEIILQNIIINEFNDFYNTIRKEVQVIRLNDGLPNIDVLKKNSISIQEQAYETGRATVTFLNKVLKLMATIEVVALSYGRNTREINDAKAFREILDDLFEKKPGKRAVENRFKKHQQIYADITNVFQGGND